MEAKEKNTLSLSFLCSLFSTANRSRKIFIRFLSGFWLSSVCNSITIQLIFVCGHNLPDSLFAFCWFELCTTVGG